MPARSFDPVRAVRAALAALVVSIVPFVSFAVPARAGCGLPCVELGGLTAPATVCSGAVFNVTGHVVNCGSEPATVVVTMGGAPAQNLGLLAPGTISPFTLNTIMPPCGSGPSAYIVVATATNDCGDVVSESQSLSVVCGGSSPCVEVSANGPVSACSGSAITIQGSARNCSDSPATIVVTLDGGQAQTTKDVPPGASIVFDFTVVMTCPSGGSRVFQVAARVHDDCSNTEVVDTQEVPVLCGASPCVLLNASGPSSACPGTAVQITGSVTNCGSKDEFVLIGAGGPPQSLGIVAAGASVAFSLTATMPQCGPSGTASISVIASADDGCGEATETEVVSVACGSLPCVTLDPPITPRSACARIPVRVRGSAFNCGSGPATIVVSAVGGPSQTFAGVPAGRSVSYSFALPMGPCSRGGSFPFTIVATATNECGSVQELRNAQVACAPCLRLPGVEFPSGDEIDEISGPADEAPDAEVSAGGTGADVVAGAPVTAGAAGGAGLALYRPTPNPFTASMSFAFRAPSGAPSAVEIGVYDVAGRLVRKLATGAWPAGDHVVRWDATDERGARATPGVYFVRTRVAGVARVDRATIVRP